MVKRFLARGTDTPELKYFEPLEIGSGLLKISCLQ